MPITRQQEAKYQRHKHNSFYSTKLKKLRTKNQPLLEFSSATDHKKNTLIEFESLLEVTKSNMQVKLSIQIMTLPQPNAPSIVLPAPNLLNSQAWISRPFTLTPTWMIMNTCGYHDGFSPKISLMKIRLNTFLSTTKSLSEFVKSFIASRKKYGFPIFHS